MAKKKNRKKGVWVYLLIWALVFLLTTFIANVPTFRSVELDFRDYLFELRGPLPVDDSPIVLVAISEEADFEIPQKYPWPTSVYAKLVENLNRAGAKVIVFDVIFDQPDRFDLRNDTLFAEAMAKYGNVILAGDFQETKVSNSLQLERIFPRELFQDYNPNPVGLVDVDVDLDGAVRSYSLGKIVNGQSFYKLGLEALIRYQDMPRDSVPELTPSEEDYRLGRYRIQKEAANSFIINYYGSEEHFPVYGVDAVVDDPQYTTRMEEEAGFEVNEFEDPEFQSGLIYEEVFKDKIVIIGATMPVLRDFYDTPLPRIEVSSTGAVEKLPRPGYEIHAHAIQTILDGNYISRQSGLNAVMIMALFGLIIVLVNRQLDARWGFLIMALLMAGYTWVVIQAFLSFNLFLNLSSVILILFLGQVGTVGYQYFVEEKEKRRIQGMFSSYVSPKLVEQMIESGTDPQLGGDETYMTAFFSDIESFSTFSEQLEAKQLVQLINEYLTSMTNILTGQGGTLDKYIGDAIVAFFGAPVPFKDHALKACVSSQLMQKELVRLREKWAKDGWPDIVANMKNRMGMNTGEMVTGNMGSTRRFNYTMMGDNVNLAARCESGAKQFGVYTMVTESTKEEAEKYGDDCVFRLLDYIIVKGRTQPVRVYEVADLRRDADQKLFDCIGLYEEGMDFYFRQEWDEALAKFNAALSLEVHPNNPSKIFIERCQMMKQDPPPEDWDGVFVMKSK